MFEIWTTFPHMDKQTVTDHGLEKVYLVTLGSSLVNCSNPLEHFDAWEASADEAAHLGNAFLHLGHECGLFGDHAKIYTEARKK